VGLVLYNNIKNKEQSTTYLKNRLTAVLHKRTKNLVAAAVQFLFPPHSRSGLIFDEKWAVRLFFEPAGA